MDADVDHKDSRHKVHFDESDDAFDHDSNILLTPSDDGYNVHLGFLQVNHWYHISFSFSMDNLSGPIFRAESEPASNIKLLEVVVKKDNSEHCLYQLKVELFAFKEKLFKEKLVMKSCDQPLKIVTLVFNARVLGKGKGTPFLRNGIQCVGVKNDEDDSELSDWQGFEKQY